MPLEALSLELFKFKWVNACKHPVRFIEPRNSTCKFVSPFYMFEPRDLQLRPNTAGQYLKNRFIN